MKDVLKRKNILVLLFAFLLSASCNLDDGNTIPIPAADIVDLISTDADLSILITALDRADLITTLKGAGPFTLIAPNNSAFSNYLSAAGYANVDAMPIDELRRLLLNHVVSGRIDSAPLINLTRNYLETLAVGPVSGTNLSLYFDAVSGITFNGMSTIVQTDLLAANGIYHKVDGVIELPSLDTFVTIDQNFDDLETALDIVSASSSLPNQLKDVSSGPYTLFAPAEHAFENLVDDNLFDTNAEWDSVSDIDETYLGAVVAHHVVDGNLREAALITGQMQTTLEGDAIEFYTLDGNLEIKDGSGNEGALIGVFNIQAANGVMHLLPTQVLLPDTTN